MINRALLVLFATLTPLLGDILVPFNSPWSYFKGLTEASTPSAAWRAVAFDDSAWPRSRAPFYYGENLGAGTVLADMRNNYTTFYLRTEFNVANPDDLDRLVLRALSDDGFIAWINGFEVARFNVSQANPAYNALADSAIEPTWVTNSLPAPSGYIRTGKNVLAVHVLNGSRTSSDIVLDLQLDSTSDKTPPSIVEISPAPGKLPELTSITLRFSEPVQGVGPEDFLINNQPAESLSVSGDAYTIAFPQPAFGPVDITLTEGHGIMDFADPPHPLVETNWSYFLADETAPFAAEVLPPDGIVVRSLDQAEVHFSEPVTGVRAQDLLVNGVPASALQQRLNNIYVFQFPAAAAGPVIFRWDPAQAITDFANPPNAFLANSWSITVDPNLPASDVIISEFLASAENTSGLKDEDGELQDWIELFNRGTTPVSLAGWSLTDDPKEPGLWVFPNITLAANSRLVVFASAKDRRSAQPGARLHTNFKLSNEGEYLALFDANSPRLPASEFHDYPVQRDDFSYGLDSTGVWRYFRTPTPGQPNGSSPIVGVVPNSQLSQPRGYVDGPFTLVISNSLPGAVIRYTLDGTPPTETSGFLYSQPLYVGNTTILRVGAYRSDSLPSKIVTRTYLFPDEVLRQPNNPPGFPVGSTVMSGYPSDYEMDPEIVEDPAYAPEMKAALLALPVLSVVMKTDDMFGAANGIYTHPTSRGPQWERPCSVEFIPPDGANFQVDCGIQVQGNAAREPVKQPKHPFRITFKGDYGPKKLAYKFFPDSPVETFDTLVLRADFNVSWLHWNPTQRIRGQRTRDAWMKDSMRAMGDLASHNRFVHLYINGLYWGIYDPSERPDGSFGEAYLGGDKEDYDVINEGAVVDGNSVAYNKLLSYSDLSSIAQYDSIKQYLDMPQFIDYMLLHFYTGHEDWGNNKNWYTIRPKDGSLGFLYVPWDGELVLGDANINRVNTSDVPSGLHTKLLSSAQYRLDFADRVHRHFFNGGALTPEQNSARWLKRAREIELPIIAESARWGDYRRDVHQYSSPPYQLYTRDNQWRTEQNRLLNDYFPNRTATVLNQLRAAGLYPTLDAPEFNQPGGNIEPGFALRLSAPSGTIYYTTDGSDPRLYGSGQISAQAAIYNRELVLNRTTAVKARAYSGGNWSALTEAVFTTDALRAPLRVTEIMYHPNPPGDAFEFIELQNFGPLPFDAAGCYFEGLNYIFPPGSVIQPGQIIVLGSGENPDTFAARYPGLRVFGRFGGRLDNGGERLALVAPSGRTLYSIDYNDSEAWPQKADGDGYSLEIGDPFGDPDDPANWHDSATINGSPGAANPQPLPAPVRINEILAKSLSGPDWVELLNTGATPLDLGAWSLGEVGNTNRLVFPAGASLPPGGFLQIVCDGALGPLHAPFALPVEGETLILRDSAGVPVHRLTYGPQVPDLSLGFVSDSLVLCVPTPGAANQAAPLGDPAMLIINEWLAASPSGKPDWLELFNSASQPVSLRGLFLGASNQVFEITSAAYVPARGHLQLIADEKPGPDHLDFKLPAAGSTLTLSTASDKVLDAVTYSAQTEGVAEGRLPDGSDNIIPFPVSPTPGAPNSLEFLIQLSLRPNAVRVSWPSRIGGRYRIEFSPGLPVWQMHSELTATESLSRIEEPLPPRQKYYRVIALPE